MPRQDSDIVVGDILAFNAHNLATIPCDGVLVSGSDVKMDESSLTGEPEPQVKTPTDDPFVVSGTQATSGSGRLLVVAVGAHSVSGKIRAAVYGEAPEDEGSPLFQKLDTLVVLIGKAGFVAAGELAGPALVPHRAPRHAPNRACPPTTAPTPSPQACASSPCAASAS